MFSVKKAVVGTGYITVMNAINLGIVFVFYMAIARILTPSEVGSISLFFLAMTLFNTATLLALSSAVIKFVSERLGAGKPEEASAAFWKSIKLASVVAFPSLILIMGTNLYLLKLMDLDVSLIFVALATGLVLNYTNILGGAFYGLFLYGIVSIQNIILTALGRFSAVFLAKLGFGVYGVALGMLTGALTCLAYSVIVLRGRLQRTRELFPARSLLGYSTPLYVASIIALAQTWLDVAILYRLTADLQAVGIYYLVVSSTAVLTLFPNSLASVLFPAMSYKIGESGVEAAREILDASVHLSLLIITPLSLALAAVAPTALTVAYGAKYSSGSMALTVVSLGVVPAAIYALFNSTLQATGLTRAVALAGAVSVLVGLATLLFAVPVLSGVGAAMARVVMTLAGFAVSYLAVRSRLSYVLRVDWKILVYSGLSVIPVLLMDRMINSDALTKGLGELAVFILMTVFLLKILKPFNKLEKHIVESIAPESLKPIARLILR